MIADWLHGIMDLTFIRFKTFVQVKNESGEDFRAQPVRQCRVSAHILSGQSWNVVLDLSRDQIAYVPKIEPRMLREMHFADIL